MAAYGALTSLLQVLNDVIIIHTSSSHDHNQLQSIHGKVSLLLDLLNKSPYSSSSLVRGLESEIVDVAYIVEDLIESEISNQLLLVKFERDQGNLRNIISLVQRKLAAAARLFCAPKDYNEVLIFETGSIVVSRKKPNQVLFDSRFSLDMQLLFVFQNWMCALTSFVRGDGDENFMQEAFSEPLVPNEPFFVNHASTYRQGYEAYDFFSQLQYDIDHPTAFNRQMFQYCELPEQVKEEINFIINVVNVTNDSQGSRFSLRHDNLRQVEFPFAQLSDANIWSLISASWNVLTGLRQRFSLPRDESLHKPTGCFNSIKEKLIEINDVCTSGGSSEDSPASPTSLHRRASGRNVMVGLEGYLTEIQTQLLTDSPKVEVITIVGMGGIGETTLAREIYDNPCVVSHFDIHAWATVSQEYSLRQIFLGLLACTEGRRRNDVHKESEGELATYLYKSLKGKRYLIVMDHIWDVEAWDAVNRFFPRDNNGSRILLTTRLEGVAVRANSCSPIHKMRFLDNDKSWNLLSEKVFAAEECPLELREIGKEIAHNCGGLPLAILVAGGLLCNVSRTPLCWREVADNLISLVSEGDEKCLEILSLSYNHLPSHLKVCFLYLGVFPEDFEFPVSKLILLWAAEGILRRHRFKSVELVAEEYLEDLVRRSLIVVCSWTRGGKVKTCRMHDLLRELCLRNAEKENFLHAVNPNSGVSPNFIKTARRLCIHAHAHLTENTFSSTLSSYSRVRSILCTQGLQIPTNNHLLFRLLRVLDLVMLHFSSFPEDITELVNLRYLALALDAALPPSILKLWNLQTIVQHCRTLCSPILPMEIWMMPKLRHLHFASASFVSLDREYFVNSTFHLESLQTLRLVKNFTCSVDILKRIPNLKKLGISYNGFTFKGYSSCQFENLVYLHQLETLKFSVIHPGFSCMPRAEKLAFPFTLKNLSLRGCNMPWRYMTNIGTLPNLEVLKLRGNAFYGREWEPVDGEFLKLKFLLIEETNLMYWRAEYTHFPSLIHLIIRSCSRIEIPSSIGDIPTLEMIELFDCGPPAVNSAKRIEEEQLDMGNDFLEIRVESRQRSNNPYRARILRREV